jgi:hypothetical protein
MTELAIGAPVVLLVYAVAFMAESNSPQIYGRGLFDVALGAALRCVLGSLLVVLGLAASFGVGWLIAWGFR